MSSIPPPVRIAEPPREKLVCTGAFRSPDRPGHKEPSPDAPPLRGETKRFVRRSVLVRSRGREDVPSHPAPPVPTPGSSPPRCCRQIVTTVASPAQDRDVCADNITATSTLFCCVIFNLPISNVAHLGAGSRPAAPGPFSPSPRGLGAVWPLPARRKKRKRSRMGGGGGKTRRDPSPRSRCRTAAGESGGNRCHPLVSPQPDPRPREGLDPFGGNKGAKPSPKRCRWGVLIISL